MSDPKTSPGEQWGEPRTKTVTWYDPAISASAGASIPGREYLQAIADGKLPRPPIADSGELEITGRALRAGRQVAFAEAHARAADGKLVGHATTSIALVRP